MEQTQDLEPQELRPHSLSDSPFPTLSPQLSLLFADFVAGVPKGNLTYGYVRRSLTLPPSLPFPSPR